MKYLLIILLIVSFGCADNDTLIPFESLEGKWVEKISQKDTMTFDANLNSSDRTMFIFHSSNEIDGYNKLYTTSFEYKISGNQISLYNSISSCYCFTDYYFKVVGDELVIGDFFNPDSNGTMLTFVKVE